MFHQFSREMQFLKAWQFYKIFSKYQVILPKKALNRTQKMKLFNKLAAIRVTSRIDKDGNKLFGEFG